MSTSRGSGAGNGGGVQLIPAGARKVVQSLKEIVNCPDAEIYAALKDCNMDPNEAVNRLLSQDPFHEVKSKREKKKEGKDGSDFRSHGANNSSTRRSRNGADRNVGRGASAPYSASESPMHGKPTYKKENGSAPYKSNFSSAAGVSGNNRSQGPSGISDGSYAESKGSLLGTADGMPSAVQTATGYQSAWVGVPGQVSMADIVRMGRSQYKSSHASSASHHNIQDASATESFPILRSSADHASKVNQSEASSFQHVPSTHEWPSVEKPAPANVSSEPEYTVDAELHPDASGVSDGIDHHYEAEEVQEREEDDNVGNSGGNDLGSVSIPSRKIPENDSRGSSLFENELYQNLSSYQSEAPDYEHHEGEEAGASVSSVTRNFQQLNVEKDDRGFPSEGNTPSVVIPDHLQVQAADCSHLSFGSFGASMNASYSSGTLASAPVKSNLEEGHSEADISSAGHADARQSEYYMDDSIRNTPDRFHGNGSSAGTYDAPSASQPEELQPESAEVAHGNQYRFPSANTGYALDDAKSLNAAFNETSSQVQNLAQFSNVMQAYTNSLPSTLLTGNVHSARESDLQYSQFPVSQSLSAKYGNSVSSVGVSAHSMSEALKTANSSTQPAPQSLSGTGVATGPPLPQHIAVHPYSQQALPLGPFANMIGYPFLPQSYTYMPSAFQQSFAGNSTYHQSLAALLPQYKSSVSVSSLPQSAPVPSGYGNLGSTATVPGNYPMNPPAAPSGSALNYEDVLSSQYKEASHLLSLQQQQNENSAMWLHGQGSRTVQAVPSNAYYNYQGQNQQPGGFRQAQQQSQNYGAPGYPNFYHSQTGISLDQQQNPRDGALGASQGQPKQSQIWPNGY
ncbi:hypothetical protein C2S53_001638 [Perilla frutescens var. hirtella]|uniref:GBF-interacting protein 1 N-terminal domain-containing protein n=1 Tax=Perilla frutescens var. hirtella TaxID=608512 RepID=A0AAD4J301_PERFH|nr:hypothetical protein C2S53_001638 [Perilla frutescens var. hirtella]